MFCFDVIYYLYDLGMVVEVDVVLFVLIYVCLLVGFVSGVFCLLLMLVFDMVDVFDVMWLMV